MNANNLPEKVISKKNIKWHVKTSAASHNWLLLSEAKGGGIIGGKLQENSLVQKAEQNIVTSVTADMWYSH